MRNFVILISKAFKKFGVFLEQWARTQSGHNAQVQESSAKHDMARHPDENYYAKQYLFSIEAVLGANGNKKIKALDLGCGQGRLTIPLATLCEQMTGVDFTAKSLESARKYAMEAGCSNIDFVLSDIYEYVRKKPAEIFDAVIFTEAAFFLPSYKEVLREIYRVLKFGGVAFIAFRSQWFDILFSVREKKWDSAQMAIDAREGYLWGGSTWFSWQTSNDIKKMLSDLRFKVINCTGIGVCSGIEGDPLAVIARPSLLNEDGKNRLHEIEMRLAQQYADQGRYILAIAKK